MEGEPEDLTVFIDTNNGNDHTYFGNGCPSDWGDGSVTPCSTRIVKTADNEDQKNGTYFNFQATTSGTGGSMSTVNANSSDTFCPLGWQLPYSGTGGDYYDQSRSWRKIFEVYNIPFDDESTIAGGTKFNSFPLSNVYSGGFYFYNGKLYRQNRTGFYWSSTVLSSTNSYYLITWSSTLHPSQNDVKNVSLAIRCIWKLVSSCNYHVYDL